MLGVGRTVKADGKLQSFEFMRIVELDGTLALISMPGAKSQTSFRMKSLTRERVVFENRAHDFPQRIIYWKKGKQLCARIEGTANGKVEGEEWCWTRSVTPKR